MNKRLKDAIARGLEKQVQSDRAGGGAVLMPKGPSTNKLYRGNGKGKRKTPEYNAWLAEAGPMTNAARARGDFHPISYRWYRVIIRLHPDDGADVDNRAKAPLDLLRRVRATPDDKWCWDCRAIRDWSVPKNMMLVEFEAVDGAETACPKGKS